LSAARKAFSATDKQKLMEYTMQINLSSTADLHSDRPAAEKTSPRHADKPAHGSIPLLAGPANGLAKSNARPDVNGKDDSWKKKHVSGEELIRHAKEMLTQELVDVFMKDIKTRIVSPSIYDFLNPKLRPPSKPQDDESVSVNGKGNLEQAATENVEAGQKRVNGYDRSHEPSEYEKSSRTYTAVAESRHSSVKGKDLLANIEGLASLPDLSKLPRFKKRNQNNSTRERKQNGHKRSVRRSPSRSRSRRRYSESDSDVEMHDHRRKSLYSRGSSSDSSRSLRDSSRGRHSSRRRSWDRSPSDSRDRMSKRTAERRKSDRYNEPSEDEEDDAYHSSASFETPSRARTPSPYSKHTHRQRSPLKMKKVKKEHRRLRDYLSDVDDQSDEHYDFLRKLNKQEKEESDSDHDDAGFVVDDDEMVDVSLDDATVREVSGKSNKLNRKVGGKSRSKRKGSVSSDDGEPDRKKSKSSLLANKSQHHIADDDRAMELDIEQNMAQLFESESEYEDQKASRTKQAKAARKIKVVNRNLTNGVKNKKKLTKVEDEDAMDSTLNSHRSSAALDSPSIKNEAVVPSVVKTERLVMNETSEEDSSAGEDDYSETETIATDEFSDLESDVEATTANSFGELHPLKQVHDAEDIKFMKLAMQGYQTFDDNGPSETTHVIRASGKAPFCLFKKFEFLLECVSYHSSHA
jgi:hypothetical protein